MLWILGHEDSDEYWFVNNEKLRNYLNGGKVDKKYNGIQVRFFNEVEPISRIKLVKELKDWMKL